MNELILTRGLVLKILELVQLPKSALWLLQLNFG